MNYGGIHSFLFSWIKYSDLEIYCQLFRFLILFDGLRDRYWILNYISFFFSVEFSSIIFGSLFGWCHGFHAYIYLTVLRDFNTQWSGLCWRLSWLKLCDFIVFIWKIINIFLINKINTLFEYAERILICIFCGDFR